MDTEAMQAQYQQWLDWLSTQQPMTPEQLQALQGMVPGMELNNQFNQTQLASQQNDLGFAQVEYGMAKLQSDFEMNQMQVEQARKELEYQSGPYYDYLLTKTKNDTQMSNNDVTMSGNQLLMSKDALTRSGNDTLQSAYSLDAAKMQADVDKIKAYTTLGFINPTHYTNPRAGY